MTKLKMYANYKVGTDDELATVKKYSTEEKLSGDIWINNKPIYRKVIVKNITSHGTTNCGSINTIISANIELIVNVNCMIKVNSDTGQVEPYFLSTADYFRWFISGGNFAVDIGSSYPQTPSTCYIIVDYIKN